MQQIALEFYIFIHTRPSTLPHHHLLLLNFFFRFYLFILERGEGKEKKRERNINVWLPLTWPTTQACVLTGNPTGDPLVHKPTLSPLSYTIQGLLNFFYCCQHDGWNILAGIDLAPLEAEYVFKFMGYLYCLFDNRGNEPHSLNSPCPSQMIWNATFIIH